MNNSPPNLFATNCGCAFIHPAAVFESEKPKQQMGTQQKNERNKIFHSYKQRIRNKSAATCNPTSTGSTFTTARTTENTAEIYLSQAVACVENRYQVAPNDCDNFPLSPGVLPL